MANKYSRYQLQPFVSQYVDPASVQVNQVLRERYDQNKQGKDLVDRSLAQLKVMKGDRQLVEKAKGQVKGFLNGVNETGNYEDAGLAIQDAANHVDQDPGLLAAKASYENRESELQFLRDARAQGKQVLDFGKGASDTHSSYFFDEASETFQTDIYEHASESRLDYDGEMSSLLKTIKADSNGEGWEGITRFKADKVAAMMYDSYIQSDAGKQDFRRLTELDLPDSLSGEEKMVMAKKDIMHRLKGFTRQYVYNKITAPDPKTQLTQPNGVPMYLNFSGETSGKGILTDDIYTSSMQNLEVLKSNEMSPEEKEAKLKLSQGSMDDSVRKYLKAKGEEGQVKLDGWNNLVNKFKEKGDEKLFELTKMLTTQTNDPSTDIGNVAATTATGAFSIGAAGAGTGAAIGSAFFGVGAIPAGGLGAMIGGLLGGIGGFSKGLYDEMQKFRNVRDWTRPSAANNESGELNAFETVWSAFADSEEEQLMEELFGGNNGSDEDMTKINESLGTDYTKKDAPRIKALALAQYNFMAGATGGITGDQIMKDIETNGHTFTANGFTPDSSKEGELIRKGVNNTVINSSPHDWIIHGVNTKEDMTAFVGEKGELWKDLNVTDVYEGDPLRRVPIRIQVKNKDGVSKILELKPGSQEAVQLQGGITGSITQQMGLGHVASNEAVRLSLESINNPTVGNYIDLQSRSSVASNGGTKEDYYTEVRKQEDNYLLDMILTRPEYRSQFLEGEGGQLYLQDGERKIGWYTNKGINQSAWSLYQNQNPTLISQLRAKMRGRSINEIR
jgi:hypothetical protein